MKIFFFFQLTCCRDVAFLSWIATVLVFLEFSEAEPEAEPSVQQLQEACVLHSLNSGHTCVLVERTSLDNLDVSLLS